MKRLSPWPALAGASLLMGGCVIDTSTPTLTLTRVEVLGGTAMVDVRIENPVDRTYRLEGVDYTLTLGPLPVAEGALDLDERIVGRAETDLRLWIELDQQPMDPTDRRAEFSGRMLFRTGLIDIAQMRSAPFLSDAVWVNHP